jgi:hypothetical protein
MAILNVWRSAPRWVESPPSEPGSIDPLGYRIESDRIAEKLLPGVTVNTRRARYLSFLCWASDRFGLDPDETDRWEVALSVGEWLRHGSSRVCSYRGIDRLSELTPRPGDPVKPRLLQQSARVLYSGLLSSAGFVDQSGALTDLGGKLAVEFGKAIGSKKRPKRVRGCAGLPCVSDLPNRECSLIAEGLFSETADALVRARTFKAIRRRLWRDARGDYAGSILRCHLGRIDPSNEVAALLRNAAVLELRALPLTRLFLYLYEHDGAILGDVPASARFRCYQVGAEPPGLLADVGAHLRRAAKMDRSEHIPLGKARLLDHLQFRHRQAKPDSPWVTENWQRLRLGLQPQNPPGVHGYRLDAFASLLQDIRDSGVL